jgi:CheY-like chemotaxis protein
MKFLILPVGRSGRANFVANATQSLLIADDDPFVQLTYKHCFEEAGYKVGLAGDGRAAINFLKANKTDIVFLDIFMPDKDGLETLLVIKKTYPDVRVVAMTGGGKKTRHDFLTTASKFGADGVVRKPIAPSDLIEMIKNNSFPDAS